MMTRNEVLATWRRTEAALDRTERHLQQIRRTGGCPCVCNSGGFCGGCGHAGCGGRR